jgi:hypothetical protein
MMCLKRSALNSLADACFKADVTANYPAFARNDQGPPRYSLFQCLVK